MGVGVRDEFVASEQEHHEPIFIKICTSVLRHPKSDPGFINVITNPVWV